MNEIKIDGVVNTKKSEETWTDDFIAWLESRDEYFGGGIGKIKNG